MSNDTSTDLFGRPPRPAELRHAAQNLRDFAPGNLLAVGASHGLDMAADEIERLTARAEKAEALEAAECQVKGALAEQIAMMGVQMAEGRRLVGILLRWVGEKYAGIIDEKSGRDAMVEAQAWLDDTAAPE